jgi:hypothetical protein
MVRQVDEDERATPRGDLDLIRRSPDHPVSIAAASC